MESIEYYIDKSLEMKNGSVGGSAAYLFDDVALVKYVLSTEYGKARANEEEIAKIVKQKNEEGVRTPKHIAIKREVIDDKNICWVLQEKAVGETFTEYAQVYSENVGEQLKRQYILAAAPSRHYERFISDICSLFNMGLELKPKNFFYDINEGFTIIDLLEANETPINFNSLEEIVRLNALARSVFNFTCVSSYNKYATDEQRELSRNLNYKIMLRVLEAMEKVVPDFERYKRWVLRKYSQEELEFLKVNNYYNGDLKLTLEEKKYFWQKINEIVNTCLIKISNGEVEYWEIEANEIRIALSSCGISEAWLYSDDNKLVPSDYDDNYEYEMACSDMLMDKCMELFNIRLQELANNSNNEFITRAINEMEKKKKHQI